MKLKLVLMSLGLASFATAAFAQQGFGVHAGYMGSLLKEVYAGADYSLPIGPAAVIPNLDYSRKNGTGYWFGSVDLDLRNPVGGVPWWFGAGPTYGYWKIGGSASGGTNRGYTNGPIYSAASTSNTFKQWGWDLNGGIAIPAGTLKPYVTARYIKIKGFHTTGGAVGLRF